MYDANKIIPGLVIFVGLFTFPIWSSLGTASPAPDPKIDTPEIQQMIEKKCVESKRYMRTTHMQLLNNWRDTVVREGNRTYKAADGEEYNMSLQLTCMKCHSSKKNFCDSCHIYASVTPYCWDCHIVPKEPEETL